MGLTQNQQQAVDCAGRPLFIQAGAGTGKTFTLTKRLAYGLSDESGPLLKSVENVLTITFTNKAAGELLGRVRAELRARGLAEAALGIDGAWISTIHSMCQSILSAHALEARIDPGVALLSEEETSTLLQAAVDEQLGSHEMETLVAAFGPENACGLVASLASLLEMAPDGVDSFELGPALSADPRGAMMDMVVQLSGILEFLQELGVEDAPSDACAKQTARLRAAIEAAETLAAVDGVTWLDVADALKDCAPPKGGNLKKAFRASFKEALDLVADVRLAAVAAQARCRLELALGLAHTAALRHKQMKVANGAQDMNDLLMKTYELLRDNPDIAEEYRQRFDSIMVDEFQDTDSLQVKIIETFCDEGLSTLTTVGDLQQSIYGFRGADVETYRSVRAQMSQCGSQEVSLDTNYRSHPDILSFVEAIFSGSDFFGDDFLFIGAGPNNARDHAWAPAGSPRVKMLVAAGEKSKNSSGKTHAVDLRQAEAEMIADEFETYAKAGAEYGQMAILMSSTKAAGPYLAELRRRGIPCAVSGGSDFYLQREVKLMSSLLRVLELPDDDRPMLDVLASPMFDLPDGDLLSLRIIARRELRNPGLEDIRPKITLWDALAYQAKRLPYDACDPLISAYGILSSALSRVGVVPLHQVVGEILDACGWLEELRRGGAEGLAIAANVQRFCDLLADFENQNGPSPVVAGEHFRTMCDMAAEGAGAKGKPGRMVGLGNDAVQVMTIHASKGLEFPIVAVAQYAKTYEAPKKSEVLVQTEDGKRHMALPPYFEGEGSGDVRTRMGEISGEVDAFSCATDAALYGSYAQRLHKERAEAEVQRLLYVALTRARDVLLMVSMDPSLSSTGKPAKGLFADVAATLFPEGLPQANGTYKIGTGCLVEWKTKRVPYNADSPSDDDEEAAERSCEKTPRFHYWTARREHAQLGAALGKRKRVVSSYSALAHGDEVDLGEGVPVPALRDRTPKQETVSPVGSGFHLVAQWLVLKAGQGDGLDDEAVEARVAAAARRYELSAEDAARLAGAVEAWRDSGRFRQLKSFDRQLPEHGFCVEIGERCIEGFIDLLCLDSVGEKALIIDYKTGVSGSEDQLRERYALQAAVYAYAVLASDVCRKVELAFVRPEANLQEIVFSYEAADLEKLRAVIAEKSAASVEGEEL